MQDELAGALDLRIALGLQKGVANLALHFLSRHGTRAARLLQEIITSVISA